ncbi:MAG: hypothetical protein RIS70_521, partial [Planctomycetota bacterium]
MPGLVPGEEIHGNRLEETLSVGFTALDGHASRHHAFAVSVCHQFGANADGDFGNGLRADIDA